MDLRIKKTKSALSTALIVLLKKKIETITVNAICNEAMVGRSAFYSHFTDKYDLLHYSLQYFNTQWIQNLESKEIDIVISSIVSHLIRNKKIVKNIVLNKQNHETTRMYHLFFKEDIIFLLKYSHFEYRNSIIPIEEISFLCSSAIGNLILCWLKNSRSYSEDELTNYIFNFLQIIFSNKLVLNKNRVQ